VTAGAGVTEAAGGRRVEPFGDAAVLVTGLGRREVHALAERARRARRPGVREVVGGLSSVLVVVDPDVAPLGESAAWVGSLDAAADAPAASRPVVVPVRFGGPDADEVCAQLGIAPERLAALVTGAQLTVATVGFSPGFAYLEGLPPPLDAVARRARPRPVVPAGSVALAAGFAAVYPQATPGGWQLVGRTSLPLFDPAVPPYALLRPGDAVRFVEDPADAAAGAGEPHPAGATGRAPLSPAAGGTAGIVVERSGMLALVEDGGRRGSAHLGVPQAGPADPVSHTLANLLVGNPPGAAAIEATADGPTLRAATDLFVAVVGGDPAVLLDGREVGHAHVVPVRAGQRLTVGPVRHGLRTYVAVAGGILLPDVVGSRSTDVLSGLGAGPLAAGDVLAVGTPEVARLRDHLAPGEARGPARDGPHAARHWTARVLPGPHARWMDGGIDDLLARRFGVAPTSDRTGVRLEAGGVPLGRRAGEIDSQGVVTGAVQLPPDGQPIVLGPDHATLGGYPVVAVVATVDHWIFGQCRPGDTVAFVAVDLAAAGAAWTAAQRRIGGAAVGRYPLRGA
jgi:KipI family sensor histidine kinase inhibitor